MARLYTCCLGLILLLALSSPFAQAGCYGKRNRHLKKPIADSRRYFNHREPELLTDEELPSHFDWCDRDGVNYCVSSWNQHIPKYCGSCFLHATLSMVADRLKIAKGGRAPDVMLGRQTFLNCAPSLGYSKGCNGGDVIDVVEYLADEGLPDEGCMPYSATDYKDLGIKKHERCPAVHMCTNCMPDEDDETKDDCWAIKKPVIYKVKAYGNVGPTKYTPDNERYMMSEILQYGPITCSISCPDKFTWSYDGGVFIDKINDTNVDHDIEVVGWGEENGLKYWKIRNSWGQYWGVNGFARLLRGANNQQIEAGDCWYADPTWEVEKAVDDGDLIGSMYGLHPRKKHNTDATSAATASTDTVVTTATA